MFFTNCVTLLKQKLCLTVSTETPMRVVESVVDAFHCVTHGMIQNIVDPMQKITHQSRAVTHLHRQRTHLQHQQRQQQLHRQHRQVQPLLQPPH